MQQDVVKTCTGGEGKGGQGAPGLVSSRDREGREDRLLVTLPRRHLGGHAVEESSRCLERRCLGYRPTLASQWLRNDD